MSQQYLLPVYFTGLPREFSSEEDAKIAASFHTLRYKFFKGVGCGDEVKDVNDQFFCGANQVLPFTIDYGFIHQGVV